MDSSRSSLGSRLLAIVVLLIVAVIAVRLAVGLVVGFVSAILWLVVLVGLVAGVLWARKTLKGGSRKREVEPSTAPEIRPATHEDRVAAEMARIQDELRRQDRG